MATNAQTQMALPGLALSWPRLGGLLGVIGVVLFVIGVIIEGTYPVYTDSPDEIRAWFIDNGDTFLLADFIISMAIIFCLIPYFLTMRKVMTEAEGPDSLWPQIAFIGAFLFTVTGAFASLFTGALAINAEAFEDDGTIVALSTLAFYAFGAPIFVAVLFFLGTGLGIIRTGAFPAPIGWLCLVFAVTGVLSGLASMESDPEGVFSLLGMVTGLGLAIVVLITGASLLMRKDS